VTSHQHSLGIDIGGTFTALSLWRADEEHFAAESHHAKQAR
jgi:N-methylhydantoinase A